MGKGKSTPHRSLGRDYFPTQQMLDQEKFCLRRVSGKQARKVFSELEMIDYA